MAHSLLLPDGNGAVLDLVTGDYAENGATASGLFEYLAHLFLLCACPVGNGGDRQPTTAVFALDVAGCGGSAL